MPSLPGLAAERNVRGGGQRPLGQGIAGHGDDPQQSPGSPGDKLPTRSRIMPFQAVRAPVRSGLGRAALGQHDRAQMMHQLDGEEGIAARLAHRGIGDAPPERGFDLVCRREDCRPARAYSRARAGPSVRVSRPACSSNSRSSGSTAAPSGTLRAAAMSNTGGAPGCCVRARSRAKLSRSAHCRSSMKMTTGCKRANGAEARRRPRRPGCAAPWRRAGAAGSSAGAR